MSRAPTGPPLRVTTESLAFGPHAVAHADGKVLFVRGAAPHEEVDVVVREDRGRFAYAEVVAIVRPSGSRRTPPCPYLPECGGCPWQHVDYAAQLDAKRSIVAEQLRRIGGQDLPVRPVLPSPREYRYRRRLKLRVDNGRVGFYAGGSHRLVPVAACLLATEEIDATVPALEELVRTLATAVRRIEVAQAPRGVVVDAEAEGKWVAGDDELCRGWLGRHAEVSGLVLHGRGWRRAWGDERALLRPEAGLDIEPRAGTFTQVNEEANQLLVRTVLDLVGAGPGVRLLDLYAGAGNFALPAARRGAEVLAVEEGRRAVQDGIGAAKQLALHGCRFLAERAERALADLVTRRVEFDAVILDPPRSGAAAAIPFLLELRPERIVYVSCDPATLARDVKRLVEGYEVDFVQPIDLFPQTYHVETVLAARRREQTPPPSARRGR